VTEELAGGVEVVVAQLPDELRVEPAGH